MHAIPQCVPSLIRSSAGRSSLATESARHSVAAARMSLAAERPVTNAVPQQARSCCICAAEPSCDLQRTSAQALSPLCTMRCGIVWQRWLKEVELQSCLRAVCLPLWSAKQAHTVSFAAHTLSQLFVAAV